MKKIAKFGIVALLLVSLVAGAFAFSSKGFGNEAAREALEAGDYNAWKEAVSSQLTEENFNKIVEMHEANAERFELRAQIRQAVEDGDFEKAQELRAELGEEFGIGFRRGGDCGRGFFHQENQ